MEMMSAYPCQLLELGAFEGTQLETIHGGDNEGCGGGEERGTEHGRPLFVLGVEGHRSIPLFHPVAVMAFIHDR